MQWLSAGGSVCVVTSDDGYRPFESLWRQIPAELRANGRLVLSTSNGAALFYGDQDGELLEDEVYWHSLKLGLNDIDEVTAIAREMMLSLFQDLLRDRSPLRRLPLKADWERARAKAYSALLDKAEIAGESLDSLLSMDKLLVQGSVQRHQAGPTERWLRSRYPAGVKLPFFESLAKTQPGARYTSVFIMNMPRELNSELYIKRFAEKLRTVGAEGSAAPNSICLRNLLASKGRPVEYLASSPVFRLDFRRSLAFGDQPAGNDAPLTQFVAMGMPFFSVAQTEEECPVEFRELHVGGLEHGTANVLRRLVSLLSSHVKDFRPADHLARICAATRTDLAKAQLHRALSIAKTASPRL